MPELDRACLLDGQRAIFLGFNGPDRFVILAGLEERLVTREQWMALPTFVEPPDSEESLGPRLGRSGS